MSYIENTAFEPRITNASRENLAHIAGLYMVNGAPADCSAGLLCVRAERTPNEGYEDPNGVPVLNENSWYMNAAGADATVDDVIFACDTYENQLLTARNENMYFVGTETLGLGAPAGRYCNFTRIDFDNQSVYRFGIGNCSTIPGTPVLPKFFTIADGKLVPADAAPTKAGAIYFELRGMGNFVEGNSLSFGYVDVVARKVSAAA